MTEEQQKKESTTYLTSPENQELQRKTEFQKEIVKIAKDANEALKELRKTTKIGRYYMYMIIVIMILVYVVFLGYGIYKSGGITKWANARFYSEADTRRFYCDYDGQNISLRSVSEVNAWKNAFNVNCTFGVLE